MLDAQDFQAADAGSLTAGIFCDLHKRYPEGSTKNIIKLFYKEHNQLKIPLINLTSYDYKREFNDGVCLPVFWKIKILTAVKQNREILAKKLEIVCKDGHQIVSDVAIDELEQSVLKNQNYINSRVIFNKDTGDYFHLKNIISQKEQRYVEAVCILNGLNEYAIKKEYLAAAITITVSASDHEKKSPKKVHDEVSKCLKRYTDKTCQWKEPCYYFIVIDPHLNGTPHWHAIAFFPKNKLESNQKALLGAFGLKSFKSHRILWDDIDLHDDDNEAIGYLIKKIKPVIFSLNDIEANEKSARIEAYRKIWGFKAFRFIGLPQGARTLRTELRSNRYPYKLPQKLQKLREMAKGRSFSDYLEAFLEDKENIKIIRNKEKKIIGLEYNKEEFLSVKSNNEIISESRAKSNIERKTTKVALNKPRSVDLTNEVSENTETVKPQHNVTISRENILLDAREELKAKEFIEDEKLLQFIQVSNNCAGERRTTETVVSQKYESEREVVRNKHIFQIFSLPFIDIAVNKVTTYTKNLASSVIK